MTDNQWPASGVDIVRKDFVEAYVQKWGCEEKYARELMEHVELGAVAQLLRNASADRELMEKIRLKVEDELVDLRDRGYITPNRNGLVVFEKDGEPSPVIRMGTRQAIVFMLQELAKHYDEET